MFFYYLLCWSLEREARKPGKQGNQEGQEDAGTMDFILCPGVGNNRLFLQRLKSNSPHFPGWGERGFTLTGA
jgi:hypothetical protein